MRLKCLTVSFFLAATLLTGNSAQATTYFVSQNGNDSNAGTSKTKPWQSLAAVNSHIFKPGDRILLEGNNSFNGTLTLFSNSSGTAAKPLIIGSYGGGRATINARSNSAIVLNNLGGVVVQQLILKGGWNSDSQSGNSGSGIGVYSNLNGNQKLDHIYINSVDVSGFANAGIELGASPNDGSKSGFSDVKITNSVVHENGDAGITTWGAFDVNSTSYAHEKVYVGHCSVFNNHGIANKGLHSGNGILLSDVDGAVIERCVAHHNGTLSNWSYGGPVGIWVWDANNAVIQHNESYANQSQTLDGGGFDLDGGSTNSVMQYNYSHDNVGAGFLLAQFDGARPFHNNVARYNVTQNNGRHNGYGGIQVWNGGSGISSCEIYNNTVFTSPSSFGGSPRALWVQSPTTDVHFRNNILITTGGLPLVDVVDGQSGMLFQQNDYWSSKAACNIVWNGTTYSTLAGWCATTGQEKLNNTPIGLATDPKLNAPGKGGTINNADHLDNLSAYRLQANSPLRTVGLNLAVFGINPGSTDFFSDLIENHLVHSVGAHENTDR